MKLIDNIARRLGYAKLSMPVDGYYPLAYASGERFNYLDPSIYGHQADLYRTSSWIGTATQILSQACAAVNFGVYSRNKEGRDEIINHPYELLLGKPNPLQSRFEFLEASFSNYRLTGNSYTWINAASENDEPAELWTIHSDQIEPVPDEKMFLRGYLYRPGDGLEIPLEPWEVVHVKTYNPRSMFLGLSLIESIAIQAQADIGKVKREAKISNAENGRLPGILAFADRFQDAEWQNMKEQIDDRANKMRSYMLLNNVKQGGVSWISTGITQEQAQFIQQRQFTKEEIFDRVAPGLASMLAINATEANSKSGKATFSEYAMWPMLVAFAEKWTNEILPRYGNELVGEFEDVRVKDRVLELQEIAEYGRTHTVEEVRKKFYNDKPLGDKRDNLMPAQINAATGEGEDEPEPEIEVMPAQQPPQLQAVNEQPAQEETPSESEPIEETEEAAEIKRWKRVARKAIKAGRPVPEFVTDVIPSQKAAAIRSHLATVKSVDEIDAAFEARPREIGLDRAEELVRRLEVLWTQPKPLSEQP